MHVVVTTDGSKQSLSAAKAFKSFADPAKVTEISVVAVIRPLAAVSFADDLSEADQHTASLDELSFRVPAERAAAVVAGVFDDWGPSVRILVRSGSTASEILSLAKEVDAGLVVVASGSRGISDTVLMGSTAQRVQSYAECPVLVVREPKHRRG